ncbi:hypothetical protein D9757_005727 [Collybiopsis confluens]|uniref:Uncharacterized protein n=1 Tax=Collybiopsis confluens TaxID=2823264 RepID=A0A8H5HPW7_9AGAR|nr:hypothetical protein D9757_005727 [Collybiopsis confluens]
MNQHLSSPNSTAHIKLEEQPTNSLKRKTPPDDQVSAAAAPAAVVLDGQDPHPESEDDEQRHPPEAPRATSPTPPAPQRPPGEYENGHVVCPFCRKQVSFRDQTTGELAFERWHQHKDNCPGQRPPESHNPPLARPPPQLTVNVYSAPRPDSNHFPTLIAHPPTKRRRAKRTEEERIAYLRADPYVAQFEAYRVLCASCDKWIRLRPNSTYCSIPWDAHRKSCLSKKISNKNTYALDERNSLFSKDSDVRKFDAERVLCAVCDKWIPINPEDHLQAVQKWLSHRGDCSKRAVGAAVAGVGFPHPGSPHFREKPLKGPLPTHGLPLPQHYYRPPTPPPPHDRYHSSPPRHDPPPPPPGSRTSRPVRSTVFSNVKTEPEFRGRKELINVDADGDADADADADGDPETDEDADHTRQSYSSQEAKETERNHIVTATSNRPVVIQPLASASGSTSPVTVPALDSSAPSGEGRSPTEPIYSPAAGIFPPGPAHESRRRNAEQRAATLRADHLIKHVEPNRVFCSLCEKWVQLRQDSSYSSSQRRAQKAAEIEEIKRRRAMGMAGARMNGPGHHRYPPPLPYPPHAAHHPHHPSDPHHLYPISPHTMFPPPPTRPVQGYPPEGDDSDYLSASEPSENEDMDTRFDFRGLSASVSATSGSRSRSHSLHSLAMAVDGNEREYMDRGDAPERYARFKRAPSGSGRNMPEAQAANGDPETTTADAVNGDVHREAVGQPRAHSKGQSRDENGDDSATEEVNRNRGPSADHGPVSASHSDSGHPLPRQAGAREVPPQLQHSHHHHRSRTDSNADSRRSSQHGHSLVSLVPSHVQSRSYPYPPPAANGNGAPVPPYRSSPQQWEPQYIDSRAGHSNERVGHNSYASHHRVGPRELRTVDRAHHHRGQQSRPPPPGPGLGPYGSGTLPPSSGLPSGRGILADLDSPHGRKHFVSHSIAYLFKTTYDSSSSSADELSISALVAYLNAAMPMDKHEDFDTTEVVKYVGALREKGKVLLEGDVVKKVRR